MLEEPQLPRLTRNPALASAPHPAAGLVRDGLAVTHPAGRLSPAGAVAEPRADGVSAPGWALGKRAFDVGVALVALLLLAPLFALVALAIKLDSPGPVFFKVRRVGHRGEVFEMLKFRKMRHDAAGAPLTTRIDPRLTRVGLLLTRTRIDELPQFWDVLCGRMSIVGPRPEDPGFVALHHEEYRFITSVRPGITGLSQLAYAAEQQILKVEDPVEDYISRVLPQKLRLDSLYAFRWTMRMDVNILRWTVVTVLFRHPVAVNRTTGAMNIRRRRPVLDGENAILAVAPEPDASSPPPREGQREPRELPAARESAA